MTKISINTVIGYAVSAASAVVGILILTGMFFPEGTPVQLRITFGIVLILLSVYRMIVTTMRKPDARRTEE